MSMSVEIIAEVGECFNGSMQTAKKMIQVAADAGCDTVKFQILDMEEVSKDDPEYEWFSKISFEESDIKNLIRWSDEAHIKSLFTPVSIRTAQMMVNCGCKRVKIASSFLKKRELLQFLKDNFDDIIVSTGMAELSEVHAIREFFSDSKKLSILHCISEYPTGPLLEQRGLKALNEEDVHLEMMNMLKASFPNDTIGYSDHTDNILVPMVAAAMGAEIIEKHITLDRKTPIEHYENGLEYLGTDHVLSIEPDALREMAHFIRRIELIKGEHIWERSEGEKILIEFLRGRYQERKS